MSNPQFRVRNRLQVEGKAVGAVTVLLQDANGHYITASGATVPANATAGYAKGALFIKTDAAAGVKAVFENLGTTASSRFVRVGGDSGVIAVNTNGTTAVNVFGAGGAPHGLTVTSVVSQALDTTAGDITLSRVADAVVAIAKGTDAGVSVAGTTLANTVVTAGQAVTVVSSSAGNSRVVITYTIA